MKSSSWQGGKGVIAGGALAATALLLGAAADAATSQKLRYRFDSVSDPVTTVIDDSGKGHTGTVQTANGGEVVPVAGADGLGVQFPEVCAGAGCPLAVITAADAASLNPGTAPFTFGARVRLTLDDLSADHGSNLVQKGLYDTAQWKLQIDDAATGKPSCVVRTENGADAIKVKSPVGVADGAWHKVSCRRTSSELILLIDNVPQNSKPIAASYDISPTGEEVSIGAKSAGNNNDQYHGALDDVYFNLD
ncbi:uncharacterized protein SOCEGT47_061740 [Sorangium cellulosum]|uniref:Laminin G domain-containing protein n=1 Tax=Sorangium cellulosum TaxID=56 RepID=A0A4P2Q7Y9_SORCE|nr:laminin G domain-containing protein [Sorangium cellulosum]AUX25625.1 uncharacterized protein SOCEGT47_061740 [Sorangium cellulosum]